MSNHLKHEPTVCELGGQVRDPCREHTLHSREAVIQEPAKLYHYSATHQFTRDTVSEGGSKREGETRRKEMEHRRV